MDYKKGQVAIISSVLAALSCFVCEVFIIPFISPVKSSYIINLRWIHLFNYVIAAILMKSLHRLLIYEISTRAYFLGYTTSLGILLYNSTLGEWRIFGAYIVVLSLFHLTEFLSIAFTNPSAASSDTFVINHSPAYSLAAFAGWTEFIVETYYIPGLKSTLFISIIGLLSCFIGELFRKTAIFTAKRNFNHIVQSEKADDHELVTSGIYGICRHPSYVGWFYWSIGTQLILQNPLCFVAYTLTSWAFFNERIYIEEVNLIKFFGTSYLRYQEKVGTGLPFINGYRF